MMGNFGSWGMGFGWIIPLTLIGLVVWAVVYATRTNPSDRGDRSLDILSERYARGEIDSDTYRSMRRDLS